MNVPIWQHKSLYVVLGLTAAAGLAVWLPVPFAFRMAAAALLAFFLPGWWLLRATGFNAGDWLEQIVLSAGVSYGLTVLGALGILYVAGRLSAALVIGFLFGLQLVLMVVCLRRHNQSAIVARPCGRDLIDFLAPVGIAAAFCFANLGYSDYWGDEMNGLLRAIAVIAGRQETRFEHTRGPVEVLLPAVFGLLVGRFEDGITHVPATFDADSGSIGLAGYRLIPSSARPGDTLTLTLHWQPQATPGEDYTVFVQLVNPQDQVVAQGDGPPRGGAYPTSWWALGETIADTHLIPMPPDLSPGDYRLITGLYRLADGTRLPVQAEAALGADALLLAELEVGSP